MINRKIIYGSGGRCGDARATPSLAQGIQIGKDGIRHRAARADPDRDCRDHDRRDRGPRAERDEVSEREAIRIAERRACGTCIRSPSRGGPTGSRASDRRGDDMRVDIDRRSGEVLSVR